MPNNFSFADILREVIAEEPDPFKSAEVVGTYDGKTTTVSPKLAETLKPASQIGYPVYSEDDERFFAQIASNLVQIAALKDAEKAAENTSNDKSITKAPD